MHLTRRGVCGAALAGLIGGDRLSRAIAAPATTTIRIGLLRFGSVAWEVDTILSQGFGSAAGLEIVPVEYAASPATQVALQAGDVDAIAQDWLWVARQRGTGANWTFAPLSSAVGAIVVPAKSTIQSVADLKGKRLGVAGTSIDKSWLMMRAYAKRALKFDPDLACDKSFAAPPLLASELTAGRLDAALTYWPYAAKAEAAGLRVIARVEDWLRELGITAALPMVGYVFSKKWADSNADAVANFLNAAARARALIGQSDSIWQGVAPKTGAQSPAELAALRAWYQSGITLGIALDQSETDAAGKLYRILKETGGAALVGDAAEIPAGTFWQPHAG